MFNLIMLTNRFVHLVKYKNICERFSTCCVLRSKNFYDALEITPDASQEDVKKAYYKLSLKYHPDRASGSPEKFQTITRAYETLGNHELRREYDKTVFNTFFRSGRPTTIYEYDKQAEFYRHPKSTGGTIRYDFDSWSKAHYGETFKRRTQAKKRYESQQEKKKIYEGTLAAENVIFIFSVAIVLIIAFIHYFEVDLDDPNRTTKEPKKNK